MYKIVVYWRWKEGKCYADMFFCARWPRVDSIHDIPDPALATHILQHGSDTGFDASDPAVLKRAGYPEAAQMLRDLWAADMRARINLLKREVIDSDVPLTCEQVEDIGPASTRRKHV